MVNMSAKFDEDAHNGLVSIIQGQSVMHTHTHRWTESQQCYYIPSATWCIGIINTL